MEYLEATYTVDQHHTLRLRQMTRDLNSSPLIAIMKQGFSTYQISLLTSCHLSPIWTEC